MKKFIARSCLIVASALLVACGGGGDSATTTPVATTVTGKFVDATVVGLGYKCGASTTQSGITNASGQYTCATGQSVTFVVGGVVIGTVSTPLAVVTPLDLVGVGASPSNPHVTNIVRFLMSISSTLPSSGVLTIDSAVSTAAAGRTVDFTASTATVDALITAVRPGAAVFNGADATAHLTSSINGLFVGAYSGTFSGSVAGIWQLTFGPNGTITSGTYTSALDSGTITGTLGTTLGAGTTYVYTGTAGQVVWTGTLNINTRKFNGSWTDGAGSSGFFTN